MTIEQIRLEIAADPDGFINARLDGAADAMLPVHHDIDDVLAELEEQERWDGLS